MMAPLRILALACFALSLTTVAFAADAGDPLPEDAGSTDAAATDATAGDADAAVTDATDAGPVEDAPEPSGQFSESECWDEMCPDQINACKADPICTAYAGCIVSPPGDDAQACMDALLASEGDAAVTAAQQLYGAIGADCGWAACATNEGTCAGICGEYMGADVCNCDSFCWQYNDCCEDICDVCGANYPDECGTACQPECEEKQCGPDGCGGSCGACALGQACNPDGLCGDACQDQCDEGDSGCDGDVAWICGLTALGCTDYGTAQDCAESGMVCIEGLCFEGGSVPPDGDATEGAGDAPAPGDAAGGDGAPGDGVGPGSEGVGPGSDGPAGTVDDSAADGSDTASGNGGKSSGAGSSSGCGGSPDGGPLGSLFAGLLALGLVTRRRNA
jgi:hypothetical protein